MSKEERLTCINCPLGCKVDLIIEEGEIVEMSGNKCPRGKEYIINEFKYPTRILPTTVRVKGGKLPLVPVKTAQPIPKERLEDAMKILAQVEVEAPVKLGDIVVEDILNTGVNVVTTRNLAIKECIND
ncbi:MULTISPECIES: DUF1667 domain-containing protein [unclassified Candidatus Frackibacter]|uniref:DUF1667 domain-containing protein n=1 Tax=unclassified Candidatus Frackibacter TaxID=2648818 RepID=UPI0007950B16|nr:MULTISPECIES: DUF1667 domain-containing protein [unclassified Candidatus Frackibacter]KXS45992.1 MAG: uncharacterized protein with conserved CXXC pair [Candidatus Frackibacter sp. T328-2]SDC04129.1 CxxC motif-containing protein [Candidatus Frackibacter sp. WG11]SEM68334.1 CxxC motif-containing protein [Candidatus Frackibacter sp. WG12]SFL79599.1 CxxC motif-containing protein [Candidatus Frackibacter sp. WG13]